MQKITIKILVLYLTLFNGIILEAQSFKATYEYDTNGNRTKATVIYLALKSTKLDLSQENIDINLVDSLNNFDVIIFPNPTQSDLLIEISGVSSTNDFRLNGNFIKILNLRGEVIFNITTFTSFIPIDLSGCPNGSYVLMIHINGKEKSFKIIKY